MMLTTLILSLAAAHGASSVGPQESFAELRATQDAVIDHLADGNIGAARAAIEACTVTASLPAYESLDAIDGVLEAFEARVRSGNAKVNAVSQEDLLRLAVMLSHDEQRVLLLGSADDPATRVEREVIIGDALAAHAVLATLAEHPFGAFEPASAGLLQARGTLFAADRVLTAAGHPSAEIALAASWSRDGADAATSLRHARVSTLTEHLAAHPGDADTAAALDRATHVLRWSAEADHVPATFRGRTALAGADAIDALATWVATSGSSMPDLPQRKLAFLVDVVGSAPVCGTGANARGGTREQAQEAIERAFTWERTRDADGLHALGGFLTTLSELEQQTFLCNAAMSDAPDAVPAALALAERVFHRSALPRPGRPKRVDDKPLAYGLALTSIIGAAELRSRGEVPVDAWWAREYGALLVPLVNPMYGPVSTPAKRLETWADTEATSWLLGHVGAPSW